MAMAERFVVVVVVVMSLFCTCADAVTLKTDAEALLAFKDALQDPEGELESWSRSRSPCSWRGVSCDEDEARVVRLELTDAALHGAISPKLGELSALKVLDLSRNRLTSGLPRELARCAALVEIRLGSNYLTDAIPGEYGALRNLEVLRLESNLLSFQIPESLARCRSLRVLNVADNLLEGEIPPSLALTVLDVRRRSWFTGNHGLCGSPLQACKGKERFRSKFSAQQGMRRSLLSTKRKRSKATRWGLGIAVGLVSGAVAAMVLALLTRAVLTCYSSQEDPKKPIIFNKKITTDMLAFLEKDDPLAGYRLLGEGGNGKVYEVPLQDDLVVAIKTVRNTSEVDHAISYDSKQIRAELETLGFIRHRNLVQLLAYIFKPDSHLLIYEFMPGGSLQDALHRMELGTLSLSWPERHRILCGVAQGLAYLHNESLGSSIVHRDLKPGNILLDEGMEAKLGDFGLAAIVPLKATHATTDILAGTIGFIAPEYHQTMRYSQKSDVFSFGVVIAQLLTSRNPTDQFVVENGGSIGQWLHRCLHSSNAVDAIDPALQGSGYEAEILLAMKVAVFCTCQEPQQRPRSTQVLQMLLQIRNPEPGTPTGENLSLDSQGSDTPILTSSGPLRFPDSTSTTQSY